MAIAWLLASGDDVVPIAGMSKRKNLWDNLGATAVELTNEEVTTLSNVTGAVQIAGERYDEGGCHASIGDLPDDVCAGNVTTRVAIFVLPYQTFPAFAPA